MTEDDKRKFKRVAEAALDAAAKVFDDAGLDSTSVAVMAANTPLSAVAMRLDRDSPDADCLDNVCEVLRDVLKPYKHEARQ